MSATKKNTFRPTVENLEGRQMLAANLVSPLAFKAPGPAVLELPHEPKMAIDYGSAFQMGAAGAAKSLTRARGFDELVPVSVVTIQNKTSGTVKFQLQWPGKSWKSYSLKPGETRLYWIQGENLKPLLRYDWSYRAGYQEQRYRLTSKDFLSEGFAGFTPRRPTDGQQYYFTSNGARTGINFFRV